LKRIGASSEGVPFAVMTDRIETDYLAVRETRRAELRSQLMPVLAGRTTLTLEIGSGHGHFLSAYADSHPERFCLGIDIMSDRVGRGTRKRDRARLQNLAFVHAAADDLLAAMPGEVRLEAVFALFPDPWPKRRHWKNRLIRAEFLSTLAQYAIPGAPLNFRTDYAPYFEEAEATVGAHPQWHVDREAPWPFEYTTVFQARASAYRSLIAYRVP